MALPSAHGIRVRSAWADPTVQDEFKAWRGALTATGHEIDAESFEDALWESTARYQAVRRRLGAALRPYRSCCGTGQSWRMFSAPHRHPSRLAIDLEFHRVWERVYTARSPEESWRAAQFDDVRLRTAVFRYGWLHERRGYQGLVRWITRQAAVDFPDATRVRVQFLKARSPTPEELAKGQIQWPHSRKRQVRRLDRSGSS